MKLPNVHLPRPDYPRAGKGRIRRFLPSWRQWLAMFTLVCAVLLVGFAWLYHRVDVPTEANQEAVAQQSVLYYNNGKTVLARVGGTDRSSVALADVPLSAREAVLAAEDRGFYQHGGVSPKGLARAVWNDARGGSLQGGSTITQQLVKNYYLTQQRTLSRKANELVLSLKIERTLTKDQILEDYLNTIYYGRGAYGIQAASREYFGVPAHNLTLEQSAVLAAIIRSPGGYSPDTNLPGLKARWAYVLDGMVEQGWITPAQRQAAEFPAIIDRRPAANLGGTRGYLIAETRKELVALGFSEERIDQGGLRVVTTFSAKDQKAATNAVAAERPDEKDVRVGLASVDPATGGVLAMYGGRDYVTQPYNDATQSAPQAGSTFKPFALAAALEDGIGLSSKWDGHSPQTVQTPDGKPYVVKNYGGESYGKITLLQATEDSVNTVYVPLSLQVGPDQVVDAARRAGVPESVHIDSGATVPLGTASPTALDMASAYATFAAGGTYRAPHVVRAVQGPNGGILYKEKTTGTAAFSADVVADVDYALQKVVTDGTGFAAQDLGRPCAAKTGTTNAGRSAWFTGYVPQVATAVDLFRPDSSGHLTSLDGVGGLSTVTGGSFPARIWTAYMTGALTNRPEVPFPDPAFVGGSPSPTTSPSATTSASASALPSASPTTSPVSSSARPSASKTSSSPPSSPPPSSPTPTPTPTPTGSVPAPSGGGGGASPGSGAEDVQGAPSRSPRAG